MAGLSCFRSSALYDATYGTPGTAPVLMLGSS